MMALDIGLATSLDNAYSSGNMDEVNRLLQQNQVTAGDVQSFWNFDPNVVASSGLNFYQPGSAGVGPINTPTDVSLAPLTPGSSGVSAGVGPLTTAGPRYTELGNEWQEGRTPQGYAAFVGPNNQYVVSDEIFWNPNTPMGADLQNIVREVQQGGGAAGLTLTPYTFLDNKASVDDVLNEIRNSGVNFVSVDPYIFGDNRFTPEQGIEWTRQAVDALRGVGVDPRVVTQGFYHQNSDPDVIRRYNAAIANLPGVSEATLFGFEDIADWGPGYSALSDPYGMNAGAQSGQPIGDMSGSGGALSRFPRKSQY